MVPVLFAEALQAVPDWYLATVVFILGAAVGSFLNVLVYRLPLGLSIASPGSHCPACKNPLSGRDLVPLLSWLVLRGRCRQCGVRISSRYFWVELITACLFLALFWRYGRSVELPFMMVWVSALLAAMCIDIEHFIIPDSLNVTLLLVGLVLPLARDGAYHWAQLGGVSIPAPIWGALICSGLFGVIAVGGRLVFGQEAMGLGDVKLARAIGATLPLTQAMLSFAVAIALGALVGAAVLTRARKVKDKHTDTPETAETVSTARILGEVLLVWSWLDLVFELITAIRRRGKDPMRTESIDDDWKPGLTTIPFGPYMAVGALLMVFAGSWFAGLWALYWQWATGSAGA